MQSNELHYGGVVATNVPHGRSYSLQCYSIHKIYDVARVAALLEESTALLYQVLYYHVCLHHTRFFLTRQNSSCRQCWVSVTFGLAYLGVDFADRLRDRPVLHGPNCATSKNHNAGTAAAARKKQINIHATSPRNTPHGQHIPGV